MKNITMNICRQQGATLITALMMLLVLTIIGISAVKMSTIDILVAGNDQQKLMLMQETENDLINLTTPAKLLPPLVGEDGAAFNAETGVYQVPDPLKSNVTEIIVDLKKTYGCEGISGKAVSIGPDVPPCRLYDFQVRAKKAQGGAKEQRRRGAGKEIPNLGKNSYLNKENI